MITGYGRGLKMADPISLLAVATIATTAVGTIVSGVQANKAAKQEASLIEEQGRIARAESEVEAARVKKENDKFIARQKLSFLKNGVSLAGSPLLVLGESQEESNKEVKAIQDRGVSQQTLAQRRAKITRNQGRSSLIGSIFDAGSSAFSQTTQAKQAGFFGG